MSVLDSVFKWLGHARYNATAPTLTDGSQGELQCTKDGRLKVDIASTGATVWSSPGAATSERVVKASTGTIYRLMLTNTGASDVHVFLFNAAARPLNGSTAEIVPPLKLTPGGSGEIDFELRPFAASVGIYWGASSTAGTFTYDSGATILVATEYA